jgi:hypothetical protein
MSFVALSFIDERQLLTVTQSVLPVHEFANPANAEPLHSIANSAAAESAVEPLQSVVDSATVGAAPETSCS